MDGNVDRAILAVIVLAACGCSSMDGAGAPQLVDGTWTMENAVPGANLTFTLAQQDTTLNGTGYFNIEAGQSGTLTVTGSYHRPVVKLHLVYSIGTTQDFLGSATDATHLELSPGGSGGAQQSFIKLEARVDPPGSF